MRIKQYVVTYNNSEILNTWYFRIFYEGLSEEELNQVELFVINNHSNFKIYDQFKDKKITVLNNTLRPDFSTGHSSRSWNQGIINGFKNLTNPDADIVVLTQEDTKFEPNYIKTLIDVHKNGVNCFITGIGDQFISFTPDGVKQIGLWDERFCGIGYQDADYIMRNVLYNQEHCSINDYVHGRVINPIEARIVKLTNSGFYRREPYHSESSRYHVYNRKVWDYKFNYNPDHWDFEELMAHKDKISNNVPWFVFYPYFEKDIEGIFKQGCICKDSIQNAAWF